MSTPSSEGGTPKRQPSKLFIVFSNFVVLAIFIALTLPSLQKMRWRLLDLEKRIEELEHKLDQSKDRLHP